MADSQLFLFSDFKPTNSKRKKIANKKKLSKERRRKELNEKAAARRNFNEESKVRTMFNDAKARAKRSGVKYDIVKTRGGIPPIHIPDQCPVCQKKLKYKSTGRGKSAHDSASLDRIVPSEGYTMQNLWIICTECNNKKGSGLPHEMERTAKIVRAEIKKRGLTYEE